MSSSLASSTGNRHQPWTDTQLTLHPTAMAPVTGGEPMRSVIHIVLLAHGWLTVTAVAVVLSKSNYLLSK